MIGDVRHHEVAGTVVRADQSKYRANLPRFYRVFTGLSYQQGGVPIVDTKITDQRIEDETPLADPGLPAVAASGCSHHWVIEPANGSLSRGVCQICQEVREFENSIGWEYWQRKSDKSDVTAVPGKGSKESPSVDAV